MSKGFKISTFTVSACAVLTSTSAIADTNYFQLSLGSFLQDWSNIGLITTVDVWSGVPSITGYRGDDAAQLTGTDPQTILSDTFSTVIDVNPNRTDPSLFGTGGVTEFELTDPVVAIAGSGTADSPNLVLYLDTTGMEQINLSYLLRDIDGSGDNAIQGVALQYRVGTTGLFTNVPSVFVTDASSGPSLDTLTTPISVTLPSAVDNQSQIQIRFLTTNAVGNDEWIGVDNINVSGIVSVPEPTALFSVIGGLGVLGMLRRRVR